LDVRHVGAIPWWDMATKPALNLCGDRWGLEVTTGLGVIHFGIEVGIGDWDIAADGMDCALGLLILPANQSIWCYSCSYNCLFS